MRDDRTQRVKGSVGWLEKWKKKKRFSIKYFKICGESGDVQGVTIDSWKERLPELVRGYSKNVIWNMDETGLFVRALPVMALPKKVVVAREERNIHILCVRLEKDYFNI